MTTYTKFTVSLPAEVCGRRAAGDGMPTHATPRTRTILPTARRRCLARADLVPNGDWHAKRRTSAMARAASLTFGRPRTRAVKA